MISLYTLQVKHSQRLNDPAVLPWLIAEKDGTVLAAHCNCTAGLGEVCTHVAALLFWIDAATKLRDSKTVTEKPAYWVLPTGIQKVGYDTVEDTNFQSSKTMKRKLDEEISSPGSSKELPSAKLPDVAPPTEEECSAFLEKLHSSTKSVVLSVMPNFAQHYIPSSLGELFAKVLTELNDES